MNILNIKTKEQLKFAMAAAGIDFPSYEGRKTLSNETGINFSKIDSFLFGSGTLNREERRRLEEFLTMQMQNRVRKGLRS